MNSIDNKSNGENENNNNNNDREIRDGIVVNQGTTLKRSVFDTPEINLTKTNRTSETQEIKINKKVEKSDKDS